MIFVAVGTTYFDALIEAVDRLCPSLPEPVVMQTGRSRYIPVNCESFQFAPTLALYYERASLVISHGGLGIVTEVLNCGRRLVAVEDPSQPDRHQREILQVWDQEGYLIWCKHLDHLAQAVERGRLQQFKPYLPPDCQIHTVIREFLSQVG